MDFRNRNGQSTQQAHMPSNSVGQTPQEASKHDGHWHNMPNWLRVANVIMLFSITILALSIAILMRNGNPNENQYVATDKYQAVFLQNGQVYFGKISTMNGRFMNLQNVFYLNSQSQSSDSTQTSTNNKSDQFTLIKLGCELHGPYDQMIINRDQITFWENLKTDGQVVKTINEWIKQNPNGQKCSTSTGSTNQSNATTQSTSGTSNTSNNSTNTSTTNNSSTTNSSN
jgi:hypothetical protein